MELEKILEVVKEKYADSYIEDNLVILYSETKETYIYLKNNKIIYQPNENASFDWEELKFDNIIELKHYLDIEIKWKDLVEYSRQFIKKQHANCFELEGNIVFFLNGSIRTISNHTEDYNIATNRSYWQIYNIIKNLSE